MMRKNHDGSWTIGKREAAILIFCGGLLGSAVTVGWTAKTLYAQIDSKADRSIVDSVTRAVSTKASTTTIERINDRLDVLTFLVCLDHPGQAVCR